MTSASVSKLDHPEASKEALTLSELYFQLYLLEVWCCALVSYISQQLGGLRFSGRKKDGATR